ncbi:phosphate ABC transporter permease PstA [Borrelia miyamotoi]|uniref:Phosphate transport system permease protein PstA n=1 Tax=Borrelia miyamotoi TaxID=47466 RepID=A0AAQ3AGE7_9SPIR|nr:phosphate ABC transporter permease PstA [Borrelia miyamotoi]AGT27212.1 phosphate ABC transporter permease [Borrelia miyamotoi LB-2001]AJA58399.1 phosphate ABC transporter permease [Borrelia miyamotoi]AOW95477.1 phosphate ABC transporter, permease protein PstA [Borrelia miyamotoi]QTL83362.1 phosphate ABC transporter permease PstA [Borrelia miyamotoi]WAZ85342.1 phosphate ABC transporter permease PstA [Borrelia miyamotoi]
MNTIKINKLFNKMAFCIINFIAYSLIMLLIFIISYIIYNSLFFTSKKQTLFLDEKKYFLPFKFNNKIIKIAFIINKSIKAEEITTQDIYNIYNNKISHWGSISDQNIDIVPIASLQSNLSSKIILETFTKDNKFNNRYIKIIKSNEEMISTVNQTSGAIGYLRKEELEKLDFKKYPKIKPLKISSMSILIGKKTLQKSENEIIDTLSLNEIKELLLGTTDWNELISKNIKLNIIKYSDYDQNAIKIIEENEGTIAVVPWHAFYKSDAPFLKLYYMQKSMPLNLNFILSTPRNSGKYGGISYLILNTFYVILLTAIISISIGIGTGIMLAEYTSNKVLYKTVSMSVDILSSIPAIIFGLFGLIFFVPILGMGILSGAITSSLMILPMVIKTTEEALKSIPKSYKYGSLALGANKIETIIKILLPASSPGILTGIVLAIGRALGETAVLLFTMGTNLGLASSLNEPSRSLTVHLLLLFQEGYLDKGFATASILIIMILLINLTSKFLINKLYRIK